MAERDSSSSGWEVPRRNPLLATREYLKAPFAILRSEHVYRNGTSGERYADFDQIVSEPARLDDVVALFMERLQVIRRDTPLDFLAFIDKGSSGFGGSTVGAILVASALSLEMCLPIVLVRADREALSQQVKIPAVLSENCDSLQGLQGALITDFIGGGTEALEAVDAIKRTGGRITHCLSFACREDSFTAGRPEFRDREIHVDWFHPITA